MSPWLIIPIYVSALPLMDGRDGDCLLCGTGEQKQDIDCLVARFIVTRGLLRLSVVRHGPEFFFFPRARHTIGE